MKIYCYKCHSILQHSRKLMNPSNPIKDVNEDVYECPMCKYEIVIWNKADSEKGGS